MRDDLERLRDVAEAIQRITRYSTRGRDAFFGDELIQTWVVHHLLVIGEACRGVSGPFAASHLEIPWAKIIGTRNILVHHYFGIDLQAVWAVCEHDIPALSNAVNAILSQSAG